jgi:hypothetical protein
VNHIFGTLKTSLIAKETQKQEEYTAVIETRIKWTKTESPLIPLTTNSCSPRMKTLKAMSSQMMNSKEKELPLNSRLQVKKKAHPQLDQEPKKALYLSKTETETP